MRRAAVATAMAGVLVGALLAPPAASHDHDLRIPHAMLHPHPPVPDIPRGVTAPEDRISPAADAGGSATVHLSDGRYVSASPGAARIFRTGVGAGEPTLGVTKDGSIFFQALDGPPKVLRTKDGGKTWDDVSPRIGERQAHPNSLDPYIYVDPDTDRIFTYDFLFGCSEISFSDDGGESWTTTVLNCSLMDHQNLFAGPPVHSPTVGYENVVYTCSTQFGATIYSVAAECLKSLDGGLTWAPTGSLPYTTDLQDENDLGIDGYCHGAVGHGHVARDGTVYLPKGLCGQPWLAISRDEGLTWERVQVADNGVPQTAIGVYEHETAVTTDPKGNVYYFWIGADRLPYLSISRNGGAEWSKPMMIGPPGIKESTLPKIEAGETGKIAIVYYASTNSPGKPFPQADDCKPDMAGCFGELFFLNPPDPERYEKVTWNGYMTLSANALDAKPRFHTAMINDPDDPLVRGTCGPIRCKSVYDFIDVVIDKAGRAWTSMVDICIEACAAKGPNNLGDEGILGTVVGGPKLR